MVSFSGGGITASFVYNGDGERVKGTVNGVTTTSIGNYIEYTGSTFTRYIYAGSQRIAMYQGATLYYLASDHLGSTSVTYNTSGGLVAARRYMPWGEERYSSGTTPTTYLYSGQRWEASLGLSFFNARWYDSALGRFISADTIVPLASQGVQAWDRYAGLNNNPVRYTDPTGHDICMDEGNCNRFSLSVEMFRLGIKFQGDGWTSEQKSYVLAGAGAVADKFGGATEFRSVYAITAKDRFVFEMGDCPECDGAGAYTHGSRYVEFDSEYPFAKPGPYRSHALAVGYNIHTVVHEFGHAFAARFSSDSSTNPYIMIDDAHFKDGTSFKSEVGYAESPNPASTPGYWRPNLATTASETLANMFLGWVYDSWNGDTYGEQRSSYMSNNMKYYWLPTQ